MFVGAVGGALRANGWRARHWRPAIRAAGLEPLRPHDLRHTAVSLTALRWRHVDLLRLRMTGREVLVEVPKAISGAEAGYVLGPPKTKAGRRTVPMLTRETADRLAQRQAGYSPPTSCSPSPTDRRSGPTSSEPGFGVRLSCGPGSPIPLPHPFKLMTWTGHRQVSTIYGIYGHLLPTDAGEYRDAMSASRAAARERANGLGEVVSLASRRG